MKDFVIFMLVVTGVCIGLLVYTAVTADAKEGNGQEVCPQGDGWTSHLPGDGDAATTYTAPEGKLVAESCVKAGSDVSTDGQARKFTTHDPAQEVVELSSATGKDISHFSVRLVDKPTDEPTDDPTDPPTDDPTDEPTDDPTDEPTVDPTDEPTVDPTDSPTDTVGNPTDSPVPTVVSTQPNELADTGIGEIARMLAGALIGLGAGVSLLRRARRT